MFTKKYVVVLQKKITEPNQKFSVALLGKSHFWRPFIQEHFILFTASQLAESDYCLTP